MGLGCSPAGGPPSAGQHAIAVAHRTRLHPVMAVVHGHVSQEKGRATILLAIHTSEGIEGSVACTKSVHSNGGCSPVVSLPHPQQLLQQQLLLLQQALPSLTELD